MKKFFIVFIFIPLFSFSQNRNDSLLIEKNRINIEKLNQNFTELEKKYEYQVNLNGRTIDSISNQIGATSFNLSIFAFLFGVLAIGLGVYVTWVERKIIKLKSENESLLKQTIKNKDEVVAINELIQKDIYGLFLKIKREETVHILNRLINVPEDISNLAQELLSRELIQEDYSLLKKAYLKLKSMPKKEKAGGTFSLSPEPDTSYLVLFFQHFLDLSLKDNDINDDLVEHYPNAINCAFDNDIIKSTADFLKGILDLGYQSKSKEINRFFKGVSLSKFKNFDQIYQIIYEKLPSRNDHFKFYDIITNEKDTLIGKVNFGKILIAEYGSFDLTESEKRIIEDITKNISDLQKEAEELKKKEEERKK